MDVSLDIFKGTCGGMRVVRPCAEPVEAGTQQCRVAGRHALFAHALHWLRGRQDPLLLLDPMNSIVKTLSIIIGIPQQRVLLRVQWLF